MDHVFLNSGVIILIYVLGILTAKYHYFNKGFMHGTRRGYRSGIDAGRSERVIK